MEYIEARVNTKMNGIEEENKIQIKIFDNLQQHSKECMTELSKLKGTYKAQCDVFIAQLSQVNELLNEDVERLTQHCHSLDAIGEDHDQRLNADAIRIEECLARVAQCEGDILDLQQETIMLETGKLDTATFRKAKKKLEYIDLAQDIKLMKCTNHCLLLDNYVDKYMPVRA